MTTYESMRHKMKTGDTIAFSDDSLVSKIIREATGSRYSHVGLVVRSEIKGFGDSVLLAESHAWAEGEDVIHLEMVRGLQIHFLSDRIQSHKGDIWWVPLVQAIPEDSRLKAMAWLRAKHKKRTMYDFTQAMGSGIDIWEKRFGNKADFSKLFCSEMNSRFLQLAEMILPGINPSEQTPEDVVKFPCMLVPVKIK